MDFMKNNPDILAIRQMMRIKMINSRENYTPPRATDKKSEG
jgi:hypothetical protein